MIERLRTGTEAREAGLPDADQRFINASLDLRDELGRTAAAVDRAGTYPVAGMDAIATTCLHEYDLPQDAGGATPPQEWDNLPTMVQIWKNLGSGESATAQIWAFAQGLSARFTGRYSPLRTEVREQLAREVRDENARFCSPNAERYRGRRFNYEMAIRRAPGGVMVNGTKYFATGSSGSRYAHSIGLMEGFADVFSGGRYNVLIDLRSEGVELHDDWDNMGQRATCSASVTYHDVFVPDGFHWGNEAEEPDAGNRRGLLLPFSLAAVLLGIGYGAMDALAAHLDTRATFPGAADDTSYRYQIGQHGARLVSAEATLMDAARRVQRFCESGLGNRSELSIRISAAKMEIVNAAIGLSAEMHKYLGGQSSANAFDYDRFWRNARTLAVQDVMDVRSQQVGAWFLKNEGPEATGIS